MSIRTERVAGEITKALASPLKTIADDLSAGFITVTEVRMSPDLQLARVYISVFGGKVTPTEVVSYIEEHEAGRVRSHIARTLNLRYTPQLKFYVDDSLDRAQRIHELIDRVKPPDELPSEEPSSREDGEDHE